MIWRPLIVFLWIFFAGPSGSSIRPLDVCEVILRGQSFDQMPISIRGVLKRTDEDGRVLNFVVATHRCGVAANGLEGIIARRLLQEGNSVLLLARDAKKLESAREELSSMGSVETAELDLYDEAAVDRYVSKLDADPRHVKFLVNAAGAFKPVLFLDHTKADYSKYADLNRSFFFLTQAVVRNMKRHGGGSIVNIGSMWAKQAIKATPSSAYSMASQRYLKFLDQPA
jgi:hypothetical protein